MGKDKKKSAKATEDQANTVLEKEEVVDQATEENASQPEEETTEEKEDISTEEKLQLEVAEQKDKFLRLYSEFENYRRRTAKEKLDMVKTATQDLIKELLPVLDDFERAAKNNQQEDVEVKTILEGFDLIQAKMSRALEGKGLKKMEINPGDEFDTEFQEAITQIPAPEEALKGKIVDVVEPGYLLGEKVVRYAKVVTGA